MECDPPALCHTVFPPDAIWLPVSSGQGRNFIEGVRPRQTPVSHIDDAVRSDIISHVSDSAIRTGRKITGDPLQETIVGDEEAARRLARRPRPPWFL